MRIVPLIAPALALCMAHGATLTTVYDFNNSSAAHPETTMVNGPGGVLYGTGVDSTGHQAVFALQPPATAGGAWTDTELMALGSNDKFGRLAIDANGVLYGTTYSIAFSLTPPSTPGGTWTQTILHTFNGSPDGLYPQGVAVGADGTIYGATVLGGTSTACSKGCGTIFSITPPSSPGGAWTETVLYNFGGPPDAVRPIGVTIGAGGTLYGSAEVGGKHRKGMAFALTPPAAPGGPWTETVLYSFKGEPDAGRPNSVLTLDGTGALYGTTGGGGAAGWGAVFRLKPPAASGGRWREAVLYSFQNAPDGAAPQGSVAVTSRGIFGVTLHGGITGGECGAVGCGTAFELTRPATPGGAWTEKVLHKFTCKSDGCRPSGGLTPAPQGFFYGGTPIGATAGAIFEIQP